MTNNNLLTLIYYQFKLMKKFTLLLLSAVIALSASAIVKSAGQAYRPLDKMQPSTKVQAPSRVDIITEQPEGTLVNYLRGGEYLLSSFYGYDTDYQTGRVRVVYADDGHTVYIQDIMCYGEGTGGSCRPVERRRFGGHNRVEVGVDTDGRDGCRRSCQPRGARVL